MFAILASVPGKLKTLLDRLTSTRAANLDNLNATITSRAASSTALSNTTWTDARAGKLDNLDATIASRVPATNPIVSPPSAAKVDTTTSVTSATTVTIHSYTGKGVLHWAYMRDAGGSSTGEISIEIDGVVYVPTTSVSTGTTVWVVGSAQTSVDQVSATGFENVPFLTSLVIKGRRPTGAGTVTAGYSYRKTA